MLSSDKHYIATLLLGVRTDTEDVTGEILSESDSIPSEDEVLACARSFIGAYMQTPPMYSALKVGGRKLCDLAREGKSVERAPREVFIHSLEVKRLSEREYSLDVHCSKGTYIRTLCADIGDALGCGGTMKTLCRASASGFGLDEAHTLAEIEEMSEPERSLTIYPVERIFEKYPIVSLPSFFSRLAHSGLEIYLSKIGYKGCAGDLVRLYGEGKFFALGEIREFDGGLAIKPIRQF